MKKWMALSISLILAFGLTACGADNSRNAAAAQEEAAEKEALDRSDSGNP